MQVRVQGFRGSGVQGFKGLGTPPIHLVADSTTMSAPCFSGAHTYPHAQEVGSEVTGTGRVWGAGRKV